MDGERIAQVPTSHEWGTQERVAEVLCSQKTATEATSRESWLRLGQNSGTHGSKPAISSETYSAQSKSTSGNTIADVDAAIVDRAAKPATETSTTTVVEMPTPACVEETAESMSARTPSMVLSQRHATKKHQEANQG